jgi:hypothetical protein
VLIWEVIGCKQKGMRSSSSLYILRKEQQDMLQISSLSEKLGADPVYSEHHCRIMRSPWTDQYQGDKSGTVRSTSGLVVLVSHRHQIFLVLSQLDSKWQFNGGD